MMRRVEDFSILRFAQDDNRKRGCPRYRASVTGRMRADRKPGRGSKLPALPAGELTRIDGSGEGCRAADRGGKAEFVERPNGETKPDVAGRHSFEFPTCS